MPEPPPIKLFLLVVTLGATRIGGERCDEVAAKVSRMGFSRRSGELGWHTMDNLCELRHRAVLARGLRAF